MKREHFNNTHPILCSQALRDMVKACDVVGGFVNGFGAWVDQDCATKVNNHTYTHTHTLTHSHTHNTHSLTLTH